MCRRGLCLLLTVILALSMFVPALADEEPPVYGDEASSEPAETPALEPADTVTLPAGGVTMDITGAMEGLKQIRYDGVDGTLPHVKAWEIVAFPTQYTGVLPRGTIIIQLKPEYKLTVENGQIIEDAYFFSSFDRFETFEATERQFILLAPCDGTIHVQVGLSGEELPRQIPMTQYVQDDALLTAVIEAGGKMGFDWITTGATVTLELKNGYTAQVLKGGRVKRVGTYDYPTTRTDSVGVTLAVDQDADEFVYAIVKEGEHFQPPDETTVETPQPETPSETESGDTFKDVARGSWYYYDVEQAYTQGVVKGTSPDTFNPNGRATRGQAVLMLYRATGSPAAGTSSFTDVSGDELARAVGWATAGEAVTGITDTTFAPNSAITREQLVTILYRLAGCPAVDASLASYKDGGSVQSYAADAVAWAVQNRIINGYGDGSIRPAGYATRAEVCAILMRFMSRGDRFW